MRRALLCGTLAAVSSFAGFSTPCGADDALSFDRQIRPILSQHCFHCHGPDEVTREAGLRLDLREAATAELESGETAIVPGKPEDSALVRRIFSEDEYEVMPPPASHRDLNEEQKQTLRKWIAQGAKYEAHWAFVAPQAPPLPAVSDAAWPRTPIDSFILARLDREKLKPAPEADKRTLIRRVSLDLIGLPPTPAEVAAFVADDSPEAYEKLVDRLLVSPHYGERMAWPWLDAARYADTAGYQGDPYRTQWPWRDWVVKALNANQPFDQFTIEQLAGDLLPSATLDQKLATAFNRNHMHNGEGGRIAEETRVENVFDRAETTGTVWLGLTYTCARCHDHKFDPIKNDDYFALFDFFNQSSEAGAVSQASAAVAPAIPLTYMPQGVQPQLDELAAQIADAEQEINGSHAALDAAQLTWEQQFISREARRWTILTPTAMEATGDVVLKLLPDQSIQASGPNPAQAVYTLTASVPLETLTALRLEALIDEQHPARSNGRAINGNAVLSELEAEVRPLSDPSAAARRIKFAAATADHTQPGFAVEQAIDGAAASGGWALLHSRPERRVAVFFSDGEVASPGGYELTIRLRCETKHLQHTLARVRLAVTADAALVATSAERHEGVFLPGDLDAIVRTPAAQRSAGEAAALRDYYRRQVRPDGAEAAARLQQLTERRAQLQKSVLQLNVMTMDQLAKPRTTFALEKGAYNKPTKRQVTAGVPQFLPPLAADAPANRLALARWLVEPEHPLTARVTVNRHWQLFFGRGLVATPGDFGAQGARPTHPELLDWLAVEFIRSGWDVKHLHRLIVTSAVYRQSSRVTPELTERDPENQWLARAPRYRLPSWMLRDQALAASGLLVPTLGGPPVKPYQPPGIWEEASFNKIRYDQDHGDALYRRSLYVFWRRIVGPTMFFDAAKRQTCEVAPNLTNTPLHALTTLNDMGFVEASRALAELAIKTGGATAESQIAAAFERLTARPVTAEESAILVARYRLLQTVYQNDPAARDALLAVGEKKSDAGLNPVDLAAMTALCNLLMNLDEVLCKP